MSFYDKLVADFNTQKTAFQNEGRIGALRTKAFETFCKEGLPTIKQEDWRFTNLLPFTSDPYNTPKVIDNKIPATIGDIAGFDAYKIILPNGHLTEAVNIQAGVRVLPITSALNEPLVQKHFGEHATDWHESSFAAINTAMFNGGLYIEVAKNVVVNKPIHIVNVYQHTEAMYTQPRHLIVANQSSQIQIVETSVVENTEVPLFVNGVTECYVEENANVDYYNLQTGTSNCRFVNFMHTTQEANSLYNNFTFTLPEASLVRNNLNVALQGSNTETHLYGLYLGADHSLIDNHSKVLHLKPNCFSNELYKGVLMDESKGVFNGKIFVDQIAQKTNAFQQNNNMLLSNNAVMDTKPQLEIFADDVKCSHGSTIGSFNKESVFYLQTRGISEETAKKMMVHAFVFDVTNKIKIPALETYIESLLTDKLK